MIRRLIGLAMLAGIGHSYAGDPQQAQPFQPYAITPPLPYADQVAVQRGAAVVTQAMAGAMGQVMAALGPELIERMRNTPPPPAVYAIPADPMFAPHGYGYR